MNFKKLGAVRIENNLKKHQIVSRSQGNSNSNSQSSIVSIGTTVDWTPGTYFDNWTSQSGVTTTDLTLNSNNLVWQLYYAHKAIKISNTTQRVLVVPYQGGSNTVRLRKTISTQDDTLGSFAADTSQAPASGNGFTYTAGGTVIQLTNNSLISIPAKRYFMLGIEAGPFYRTFKALEQNRTAVYNGENIVTVVNKVYWPGWPSGPTSGIPTTLGGAATFTEYSGYVYVMSAKFELV